MTAVRTDAVSRERRRIARERSNYDLLDAVLTKAGLDALPFQDRQKVKARLHYCFEWDVVDGWDKLRAAVEVPADA
jgi:hypothetical protein